MDLVHVLEMADSIYGVKMIGIALKSKVSTLKSLASARMILCVFVAAVAACSIRTFSKKDFAGFLACSSAAESLMYNAPVHKLAGPREPFYLSLKHRLDTPGNFY